jgi:hypothetical protein
MGKRIQGASPDARQQVPEAGIATNIDPQDQRVREEPDQSFELLPRTTCYRCTHQDIVLLAISVQQGGESR